MSDILWISNIEISVYLYFVIIKYCINQCF